jgi:hypothetical protein
VQATGLLEAPVVRARVVPHAGRRHAMPTMPPRRGATTHDRRVRRSTGRRHPRRRRGRRRACDGTRRRGAGARGRDGRRRGGGTRRRRRGEWPLAGRGSARSGRRRAPIGAGAALIRLAIGRRTRPLRRGSVHAEETQGHEARAENDRSHVGSCPSRGALCPERRVGGSPRLNGV